MRGWAGFLAAMAVLSLEAQARAADSSESERCIAAAETGQELRDSGKYQLARDAFLSCQRESCPAMIREDCTQWLSAIEERMPTLVLRITDPTGTPLAAATALVDQSPVALDGSPIRLEPGHHVFRVGAPGYAAAEESVVLRDGERNRVVEMRLVPGPSAPRVDRGPAHAVDPFGPSSTSARATQGAADAPGGGPTRGPGLATWVLAGVAVAAFGSETFFGVSALNQHSTDRGPGGCAPQCAPSELDSIRTKAAVADVSLGVGLVSAGLAAYLFLVDGARGVPKSAIALEGTAYPSGGGLGLRATF